MAFFKLQLFLFTIIKTMRTFFNGGENHSYYTRDYMFGNLFVSHSHCALRCATLNPIFAVSAIMTASSCVILYVQNNSRKGSQLDSFGFKCCQGKRKDTGKVTHALLFKHKIPFQSFNFAFSVCAQSAKSVNQTASCVKHIQYILVLTGKLIL